MLWNMILLFSWMVRLTRNSYVNVHEAAKVLGFHWETVERMCRDGRIPAKKIHNKWLVNQKELDNYFKYSESKTRYIRQFEQKLKSTRQQLGISQSQLAVILGVSTAALSRWEHCNRSPRAKHAQEILRWLQQVDNQQTSNAKSLVQ